MARVPDGYRLRPPREDDVPAIATMLSRCEDVDEGEAQQTEEDVRIAQRSLDVERNVRVVEDAGGQIVAIWGIRPRLPLKLQALVAVDPDARGRGLGTALAELVDTRAREIVREDAANGPVDLAQPVGQFNDGARALLERHGYAWQRRFWTMEIELSGELAEPAWPEAVRLQTMADGVPDRLVYDAMEDAFADHWGFVPHDYAEWRAWGIERESFDPTLWFVARDGDEVAGAALCAPHDDVPWVHVLGVRRPWRRRGLGRALLLHAFADFRRRGYSRALLGVDSENPTGATRLYEKAGMQVKSWSDSYAKAVAP